MNACSETAETIITRFGTDHLTFIDRVALEASPPFKTLPTLQSRLCAAIFSGCDYEAGVPQHGLASVLRSKGLTELSTEGWSPGEDDRFAVKLQGALSGYRHKSSKIQADVRNYRISLDRMLEITRVMTGQPVEGDRLFTKTDLAEEVKAAARLVVTQNRKRRSDPVQEGDLVWPFPPPPSSPPLATSSPKPRRTQRQLGRESTSSTGRHRGPVGFTERPFAIDLAESLPEHLIELAKRVSAANPANEEEPDADDEAAGDVVSDNNEDDEDGEAKFRSARRIRTMTEGAFERRKAGTAPKALKEHYAVTSRSVTLDLAFRRLAMPPRSSSNPDLAPDPDASEDGAPPDRGQPASLNPLAALSSLSSQWAGGSTSGVAAAATTSSDAPAATTSSDKPPGAEPGSSSTTPAPVAQQESGAEAMDIEECSIECGGEEEQGGEGGSGDEGSRRDGGQGEQCQMPRTP